jgi:putative endonuclease
VITVYVLRSIGNRRRYVGITENLPRRLTEHRKHSSTVGKLLGSFELIYQEPHLDYAAARGREKFFKSGQGREWLNRQVG